MTPAIRLCVVCLLFSVALLVDCARRDVDPETSSTTTPSSTADKQARCVDITSSLESCRQLGYRQMRLPSLLNSTANSSLSAAAFIDDCGEDGLVLMCSLLAPVCIDTPIWPCASLCRNVSANCGAASKVATFVDCDLLPSDDQLCIGPNSTARKVPYSTETVFDARLERPQRKKVGPAAAVNRRRNWKARRASSRRTVRPSTRRTRKWDNSNNGRTSSLSETVNTTVMTSCSVCADQLSRRSLTERLCTSDFVAKVQPSRYIRAGVSLKLLASKSTKFYKTPKSSASSRRRAVFFLHGASVAHCPCLQSASVVDGQPRGRDDEDEGSLLVAGRVEEVGGRRRRTRLVVTAALPLSSRTLFRRALRLTRNDDVCQRRTERRSSSRPAGRRRPRPDRALFQEQTEGQVSVTGGKSDGRKRSRSQQRVVDGARPSRKRNLQRNRRGRQQRRRQN